MFSSLCNPCLPPVDLLLRVSAVCTRAQSFHECALSGSGRVLLVFYVQLEAVGGPPAPSILLIFFSSLLFSSLLPSFVYALCAFHKSDLQCPCRLICLASLVMSLLCSGSGLCSSFPFLSASADSPLSLRLFLHTYTVASLRKTHLCASHVGDTYLSRRAACGLCAIRSLFVNFSRPFSSSSADGVRQRFLNLMTHTHRHTDTHTHMQRT